jgi:hypothetical protein
VKVNIYETVEVSDEQRVQLGAILDGKVKPKRQATRDEIKGYVWQYGKDWEVQLMDEHADTFHESNTEPEADEADDPIDELDDLI